MSEPFEKIEGLGNDFIVVAEGTSIDAERAMALCDRHLGVGADGVLFVDERRPAMRVLNADGSRPEMCGNGVRCVALYLAARGRVEVGAPFVLETDAGPHTAIVERLEEDGRSAWVEVAMRAASLSPETLPLRADAPWVDEPFEVAGVALKLTAVSMGNPHAVTFDSLDPTAAARLGPRLERDPVFPEGVNAGFATLQPDGSIALRVWERGVGLTRACGTGACAAAVAAVETGRARRGEPLRVHLSGGPLEIPVGAPGEPVRMTGPARRVFRGELP